MNFSRLVTPLEWTNTLQELTILASSAIQKQNSADINDLHDTLQDYRSALPINLESLDGIAFRLILELNNADIAISLVNINELSRQLKDLVRILDVATSQLVQDIDTIQLKNTKDFLSKAKISLNILKGLRNELDDNTTDLGRKVAAVFKAIQDFEAAFPEAQ